MKFTTIKNPKVIGLEATGEVIGAQNEHGYIDFVIHFKKVHDHAIGFELFDVNQWTYEDSDPKKKADIPNLIDDDGVTAYATGTIKWDGCSHVYFRDYIHMCGLSTWQKHVAVMEWLYKEASARIESFSAEDKWGDS